MLVSTGKILHDAAAQHYAIGAFNVYNMEGVMAVIRAAKAEHSPVMLQLHPKSLEFGGVPLVKMCLSAAEEANVPVSVHLDHSTSDATIRKMLLAGVKSIMADGSHLAYAENVRFTREMADYVHENGGFIEAELGRISGSEDGISVADFDAQMTRPEQAAEFARATGIDALAICIGNVHGKYPGPPRLDFERLERIRESTAVPLVMHGASGLPAVMIQRSIELGICKFNVNTEVRAAYIESARQRLSEAGKVDLVDLMESVVAAMQAVVSDKLRLFGSVNRA